MTPASAFRWSTINLMRERADCIQAGECVWGHINGVCPHEDDTEED